MEKHKSIRDRECHATADSIEMVRKAISVTISHCNPQKILLFFPHGDVQHKFTSVAICRWLLQSIVASPFSTVAAAIATQQKSITSIFFHIPFHRFAFNVLSVCATPHHIHKYYSITPDVFKVLNVHLFMQISLIDLLNGYTIFGSIRCISRAGRLCAARTCECEYSLIDKKCINGRRWLTAW